MCAYASRQGKQNCIARIDISSSRAWDALTQETQTGRPDGRRRIRARRDKWKRKKFTGSLREERRSEVGGWRESKHANQENRALLLVPNYNEGLCQRDMMTLIHVRMHAHWLAHERCAYGSILCSGKLRQKETLKTGIRSWVRRRSLDIVQKFDFWVIDKPTY